MPQKANLLKTNFSSGAVSPLVFGRTDITRNQNGAAEINNMIVQPHGGVTRRMGTIFNNEVKSSGKATISIPFIFNDDISYVLEFGEFYVRFIRDHVLLAIEVATPYTEADLADIDFCQSADVLYITSPNHYPRTLSRFSDLVWQLDLLVHEDGPYRNPVYTDKDTTLRLTSIDIFARLTSTVAEFVPGDVGKSVEYYDEGFPVIGLIATYINATTVDIRPRENVVDFASIDKQAVITYAAGPARIRSSLSIWSSETEYSYIKVDGTWRYATTHNPVPEDAGGYSTDVLNSDSAQDPTMKVTTGFLSIVLNSLSAVLTSSSDIFSDPRDIGRQFRLTLGGRNVWGTILTVTSARSCTVSLGVSVPLDGRNRLNYLHNATTVNWRLGAWYVGNYPAIVSIHQQRLVFAQTSAEADRVWMSQSDDYVSFSTANKFAEVLDNSALNFRVGSGEVSPIRWIQSGPVLLIGTQTGEYQVKPSSISEPLTPTNIAITPQTTYGGIKQVKPIKIGSATLFIQKHGVSLREMSYSFEIDSFTASDLTIIAEHIIRKNGFAIDMCYQQIPATILWVACSNGKLLSFTYEKEHQVFAWAEHELPSGYVESMCCIPNNGGNKDEVYFVVRRFIDGGTKRYIEYMAPEFQPSSETDKLGMIYLDCSRYYNGAPTTIVTGLDHLEGEVVGILANESVHPPRTVIAGQVDLDYAAERVYVGINFRSYLKTLPQEGGSKIGTAMGKIKKLQRVDALVSSTIGLKYGRSLPEFSTQPMTFIKPEFTIGQSPDLYSGFLELTDDSGFNKDGQFFIVQDQCYPLNILSLMPTVIVNE